MLRPLVLAYGLAAAAGASPLPGELTVNVSVSVAGEEAPVQRTYHMSRGQILLVSDFELGDSVEGQLVSIRVPPDIGADCRVQSQYETSVTIGDEGPHLDLVDWIHHTSDWVDAKRLGRKRGFRLPVLSESDRTRFPEVPVWELRDAVLERGGQHWVDLIQDVEGPLDLLTLVDVSVIRMRVVCGAGATADVVGTLEFQIPMGC